MPKVIYSKMWDMKSEAHEMITDLICIRGKKVKAIIYSELYKKEGIRHIKEIATVTQMQRVLKILSSLRWQAHQKLKIDKEYRDKAKKVHKKKIYANAPQPLSKRVQEKLKNSLTLAEQKEAIKKMKLLPVIKPTLWQRFIKKLKAIYDPRTKSN